MEKKILCIIRASTEQQETESQKKEPGLTQEDLAYSADVDRTYIGYIENGKNNVTIAMLYKIAKALKLDLKELL